jgi:hypothetical protein
LQAGSLWRVQAEGSRYKAGIHRCNGAIGCGDCPDGFPAVSEGQEEIAGLVWRHLGSRLDSL